MATETASSTTRDEILGITELCEAIISHLPPKDVLLVQRVSKTWNDTIKGSLMLQRALGFQPNGERIKSPSSEAGTKYGRLPTLSYGMSAIKFLEASNKPDAYVVNPLLEILGKKAGNDLLLVPDFSREQEPSWDKIFTTQPPAMKILVDWQCPCICEYEGDDAFVGRDEDPESGPFTCFSEEGLTFADLPSALEADGQGQCHQISAFCWGS